MRGGRPAPDSRPRGPQDNGGSQQGGTPLPGEGVHFGNLWGQTGGGAPLSHVGRGQQGLSVQEISWVPRSTGWSWGAGKHLSVNDPSLKWNFM